MLSKKLLLLKGAKLLSLDRPIAFLKIKVYLGVGMIIVGNCGPNSWRIQILEFEKKIQDGNLNHLTLLG